MNRLVSRSMAIVAISLSATAFGGVTRAVNSSFRYQFFGTDVASWSEGRKTGPVTDQSGEMAQALNGMVKSATTSVDMAAYGIQDQKELLHELRAAISRKAELRIVVDQEKGVLGDWSVGNFSYPDTVKIPRVVGASRVTPDLNPNGQPRSGTIMHDKFVVVDRRQVWMGSANFSATCMGDDYNANIAMLIDSPAIAAIYADEFKQMFEGHLFSRYKHPRASQDTLKYADGTEVQVFFSPEDNALSSAVLPFINSAKNTLDLGLFVLTNQAVTDALVRAVARGVDVRIIYDAVSAAAKSSQHQYLRDHGVTVRVETWGGKMHMKGGVADGKNLLIGSMNWSDAGSDQNDENTMWIRNNPALAAEVKDYIGRLWQTLAPRTEHFDARAEGPDSLNSCQDGIDNDFDGFIDDADSGC